ncbi:Methionine aminopeptidase 1 [subsurface metagenome]
MNLKSKKEIKIMQQGGKKLKKVLDFLTKFVKPGTKTKDLEILAKQKISELGGKPSFLGYRGYPAAICVSINDEVVHGIPSNRVIKQGDIVSLDLGFEYKGFHTDSATTMGVGKIKPKYQKLIFQAKKALDLAILEVKPENHISDIGFIIQNTIEKAGFSPITDLSGHGIGKTVHEEPAVLNFGQKGKGQKFLPGMTFTIEPMVAENKPQIETKKDGWTIKTLDGGISTHFEHTLVVTKKGFLILTA